MPPDPSSTGLNADTPALWLLNARIPHTQQYGNCSCWATGCGEFDVFEVLSQGNDKAKSTFHDAGYSGGDANYFARPLDGTIRVAVAFDGASEGVVVTVLGDGNDEGQFPEELTAEQLQDVMAPKEGLEGSEFGV
jgi:hypothetical protein